AAGHVVERGIAALQVPGQALLDLFDGAPAFAGNIRTGNRLPHGSLLPKTRRPDAHSGRLASTASATAARVAGVAAAAVGATAPRVHALHPVRHPDLPKVEGPAADGALQIAVGEIAQRFLVEMELPGDLFLHDISPRIMRAALASAPK